MGVSCGTLGYWGVVLLNVPVLGLLTWLAGRALSARHVRRLACHYQYVEGDVQWDADKVWLYSSYVAVGAVAAGMLGVGGGMILGPIFNELEFLPQVLPLILHLTSFSLHPASCNPSPASCNPHRTTYYRTSYNLPSSLLPPTCTHLHLHLHLHLHHRFLRAHAQVSSATSTIMVFFMSSANVGQFIVFGMLDLDYACFYGTVGIVGAVVGTKGAKVLLDRTGRASYLVFFLAFILLGSGVMMGAAGIPGILRTGFTGFRPICGRAGAAAREGD